MRRFILILATAAVALAPASASAQVNPASDPILTKLGNTPMVELREGFDGYKELILKPDASTASTIAHKSGARQDIEDQGYKIVANVDDQYSDLAGGHSGVAFKLPNPFYLLP